LPSRALSRTLDTSMMPSSIRQHDSCTYKLYGQHCEGTMRPLIFVVLVPRNSSAMRSSVLPCTL
jgi:hypothetical protein